MLVAKCFSISLIEQKNSESSEAIFGGSYNKAVTPIIEYCDDFSNENSSKDCKLDVDVWFEIHSLNESKFSSNYLTIQLNFFT